ncbi:MAG: DUF6364 family protein [Janthinobacterium lividum]
MAFSLNVISQLTITLGDNLLQAAQVYAQQHGQELDALVAQLLTGAMQPAVVAKPLAEPSRPLSPRIQRLFSAVQVPANFDYKKTLNEVMQKRYGV